MTTQTEEPQVAEGAVSVERALGRLEGKNDLLIRMVDGQGRQAREDYQRLDAKIDKAKSELDAKIDAKMDKLLYWILGVGGFTAVTVVGSALAVIFAQR